MPGVPRASRINAPLYDGTRYQHVTGMSLSAGYKSHRPHTTRVCAVCSMYPHCCSLSSPGMRNCPCDVSQPVPWGGWAVAVSLPVPHRHERRDPRGVLHCSTWAVYLFPGWESCPGLQNPSAVPPPQHHNTWKGLNLVLNVMRLCKSQGCNAVQKQTENMA